MKNELQDLIASYTRHLKYLLAMVDSDPVRQAPGEIERKKVWAHGDGGFKDCYRKERPVYTAPEKFPDECRRCLNDEWYARGYVLREKETKRIRVRETPDGKQTKVD